ncbi:hypothetical protein SEA_MARKY_9 [Streptomyces phage Marky]|nr:hypothetical protein SEA_MARKY_9 [Streptomyces phage Marky]
MPSTNIPVKSHTSRAGDQLGAGTTADPANGNSFANDGNTLLLVLGVTATKTLTVVTSGTVGGLAIADLAPRSIAVGEYHVLGPFPVALFGDRVEITHEAASAHKLWPFNNTAR